MDLVGEGFERNDAVEAVRIELAELLEVPKAIFWSDEHPMAVQHVRKADCGVFQPGNVHEPGPAGEKLLLSGTTMMEGVVNK